MTEVPPTSPMQPPLQPSMGVPQMPTPRGIDGPSESEIIPFRSTKINILKSGMLIPVGVTAAVCVLLFSLSNFYQIMYVFSAYLLFCMFYAAYVYSGVSKPVYIYVIPVAILYVELTTPILNFFIFVFRSILPGGDPAIPSFITVFISMFFGAGLMEELMKALPGLLGLFFAMKLAASNAPGNRYMEWLRVSTPLEGLMLGIAAGAGFIFVETLFQYVPNTVQEVTKTAGAGSGFANGFALLLPRVLHGAIGHMAWAGISGYFIGLVARYPKSMVKLLAIGWLTPALLHAFWNSGSYLGMIGPWLAGAATLFVFIGCFLKAKQLETVRQGQAFIPTDSIIIGGAPLPIAAGTLPEEHATAWGGLSQIVGVFGHLKAAMTPAGAYPMGAPVPPQPYYPPQPVPQFVPPQPIQQSAPQPMQQPAPQPVIVATPAAVPVPRFTLSNGAERFGIVAGQTIDLAMLFPARGLLPGTLAEVTVHPQDPNQIGLKNMTAAVWAVTLDTGATTTVAAGRSVKLVSNEKIKIGDVTIDVQAI